MDIIKIIFLSLVYMIEPVLWMKSMSVMKPGLKKRIYYQMAAAGYYILTLIKQSAAFSGKSSILTALLGVVMIVYLFFVPLTFYKEPLSKKLMNVSIFSCCVFVTESISMLGMMFLLRVTIRDIGSFGWINSMCTLAAKCMLGVLCYLFFFQGKKRLIERLYGNREIIPLILVNFLLEMPSLLLIYNKSFETDKEVYLLFLFVQIILFGNTSYIIYVLLKHNNRMSWMEEELNKNRQIIELSSRLADLKHDISFHADIMKNLADTEQYTELKQYIHTAFADIDAAKNIFTLSDKPLSSMLNVLAARAEENDIDFQHIILVEDFILPSSEICSLLSNIVNNAMEAVLKLTKEERVVSLEIAPDEVGYYISCMNPYQKKPRMQSGTILTSKPDKLLHGRGLGIIRKIAQKNHGIAKITMHESCFEVYCFIPKSR